MEGINANEFQILPPDIVVINCGDKKSMFQRKTVSGNFRSTHNICSVAYRHVKEKFMAPKFMWQARHGQKAAPVFKFLKDLG
jgi:hypothetical protein